MRLRRLTSVMAIIGVGLAVGAPFALGGTAVLEKLGNVPLQIFIILAGLSLVSGIAKAGKLQILMGGLGHRLPFPRTIAITLASDFAFLSSPAGAAGYVVTVALLRKSGTSWTASMTILGAEQALDLLFFAIAVPVAAISGLAPLRQLAPNFPGSVGVISITVALLAVIGLWWCRHPILKALCNLVGAIPWLRARQERIGEFVAALLEQIGILIRGAPQRNAALMLLTALQWTIRYGVLWLVLREFGYRVPFGFVLISQIVILHLAQWTGIPAGGGSADLWLATALASWVANPAMATVLLLWRFSTLYVPLIVGAISLAALTYKGRTSAIATP